MTEQQQQVPTLYLLAAAAGILFGFLALVVVSLNYLGTRRNRRAIKTILQGIELILAAQEKEAAEKTQAKSSIEKTLRELEHDHDKFNDALEGYAQTLARIEAVARQVKENQYSYLMKNNSTANGNKVKITQPKTPDSYEAGLVNALIRSLVDKMQNLADNMPNNKPPYT